MGWRWHQAAPNPAPPSKETTLKIATPPKPLRQCGHPPSHHPPRPQKSHPSPEPLRQSVPIPPPAPRRGGDYYFIRSISFVYFGPILALIHCKCWAHQAASMEPPFANLKLTYKKKAFIPRKRQPFKPLDRATSGMLRYCGNDAWTGKLIMLSDGVCMPMQYVCMLTT